LIEVADSDRPRENRPVMKTKKGAVAEAPIDTWAFYQSLQLTPEQKAEARAELERMGEAAEKAGVYRRLADLFGKVHLKYDIDELREDRD
jgi:hypothetical protein